MFLKKGSPLPSSINKYTLSKEGQEDWKTNLRNEGKGDYYFEVQIKQKRMTLTHTLKKCSTNYTLKHTASEMSIHWVCETLHLTFKI